LEGLQGLRENLIVVGAFAIAYAAWWGAYRMSNFRSRRGFVVIALGMLGPLGALLDLQYYVKNPFRWASTAMLLFLIGAASLSEARPYRLRERLGVKCCISGSPVPLRALWPFSVSFVVIFFLGIVSATSASLR
jgi:hypothetical protein